jgi:hypothetical protein
MRGSGGVSALAGTMAAVAMRTERTKVFRRIGFSFAKVAYHALPVLARGMLLSVV